MTSERTLPLTAQSQLISSDVPAWLLEYGEKLNWNDPAVASRARREVKGYLLLLSQKSHAWQSGVCSKYTGNIPRDVVSDISSINWLAVGGMMQQTIKALLPKA